MVEEKTTSRNKLITRLVILVIVLVAGLLAYRYFSEKTRLLNGGRYYTYGVNKFKEAQGIAIDSTTTTTTQPAKPIDRDLALEAVENFRQSVNYDKQRADSWVAMAEVYTKINEFEKAIEVLEEASEVKYEKVSDKVTVLTALGDSHFRLANYDQAALAYDKAIKTSPVNPIVALSYATKVLSLLESGNTEEIDQFVEWVRKGQELDSRAEYQHIYHYALGWTYEKRGRQDQAMNEYTEAMSYNDKYPPLLYRMAIQEQAQGLFFEPYLKLRLAVENSTASGVVYAPAKEALSIMDAELALKPTFEQAEILVKVGNYYYDVDSRNTEVITELYNNALEVDSNAPAAAIAYARLAAMLLDTRIDEELQVNCIKAIEMTQKGVEVAKDNTAKSNNYVVMAKALRVKEDYVGAIDASIKATKADLENYKAYLELAVNYYEAYNDYYIDEAHESSLSLQYERYLYSSREAIQKAKELVAYDREVESYLKRIDRAIDRLEAEKADK